MDQGKLGKFIEKLRKNKDWTQKDLGDQLGVSNGAVSKWECGNNLPDISMLDPLSKAFDISIMNLLNCQEPSEEELELKRQASIRRMCYRNMKYLTCILCLVLLIALCCLPLVLKSTLSLSKKGSEAEDRVRVFEFVNEENENFLIMGYIISNSHENIVNITNISYQSKETGTIDETYINNIKLVMEINQNEIYSIYTDSENEETKTIDELINEILMEKENEIIGDYSLSKDDDFTQTFIKIDCYKDESFVKEFIVNVKLNEKLS